MKRIFSFDVIRSFAIFLVVCIHSQGALRNAVILEDNPLGAIHWCCSIWHIIYIGVPLFVMLSGALLLDKQEPLMIFFKKRFSRILIPFAVWSVVMGLLIYYKENHSLSGSLVWITESTMTNGVISIYWYVYLILGLYLITPLLRMILAQGGNKAAIYITVLIFSFVFINRLFPSVLLAGRFACDNLLWIGYYVLGYLIVKTKKEINRKFIGIFSLIGFIIVYFLGVVNVLIYGNESLLHPLITIIEAVLAFLFLSILEYNKIKEKRIIREGIIFVSETSYGIYLTHFLFISLLLGVPYIKNSSLIVEPFLLAVCTFVVDVILMAILKKLGLKKWIM